MRKQIILDKIISLQLKFCQEEICDLPEQREKMEPVQRQPNDIMHSLALKELGAAPPSGQTKKIPSSTYPQEFGSVPTQIQNAPPGDQIMQLHQNVVLLPEGSETPSNDHFKQCKSPENLDGQKNVDLRQKDFFLDFQMNKEASAEQFYSADKEMFVPQQTFSQQVPQQSQGVQFSQVQPPQVPATPVQPAHIPLQSVQPLLAPRPQLQQQIPTAIQVQFSALPPLKEEEIIMERMLKSRSTTTRAPVSRGYQRRSNQSRRSDFQRSQSADPQRSQYPAQPRGRGSRGGRHRGSSTYRSAQPGSKGESHSTINTVLLKNVPDSNCEYSTKHLWIVDSGAAFHITHQKELNYMSPT
ncbi:uncharacterized protein [Erythrolamprus reginae]|uniref:uncharacterized protein n=1 Tax=Erythrolamprus reginae TaxID=121349 RepID=UPI00396CAF7E